MLIMDKWRLEVIREIEGLEMERRRIFKRIERITQGTITKNSFSRLEQEHICLKELHTRIPSRINDWTDLMDTYQEGEPLYPAWGEGDSRYRPDNKKIMRDNSLLEDVLNSIRDKQAHFIASLSAEDHSLFWLGK